MGTCILSVVPRGYLPWLRGGLEITASLLIEQLLGKSVIGHIAAASARAESGLLARALRKVLGPYCRVRWVQRHQVHTDLFHPFSLGSLVARLRPSVVVCHVSGADVVSRVIALDLPTLFYVHDARIAGLFANVGRLRRYRFAAESAFIARLIAAETGEPVAIIRPVMPPEAYRVESGGDSVLVVNPHPLKGGDKVVEIAAALQHRHFIVAGGWASACQQPEVIALEHALARLPNVERVLHCEDLRSVFRRSRCLLMPCVVEEAFGRTAAEALIAGVPVVASDRGALPETVGCGGLMLSPDAPTCDWLSAIESLFLDNGQHSRLVAAALRQAAEPSRQPEYVGRQISALLDELLDATLELV